MNRITVGLFGGLVLAATAANGQTVALNGYFFQAPTVLQNAGFTVLQNINLNNPISGVDCLWLDRGTAPNLNGTETQNVLNFLNNGGRVMTEFTGSDVWFNGKFASFQGTPQNSFYVPGFNGVCGGNTVYANPPGTDWDQGMNTPFTSADPIGVFNVYTNLDPSIHLPWVLHNDPSYGDLATVGCADIGKGTAVIFFTDFADFNGCGGPETNEEQLLINAITARCEIPAPGAGAMLGFVGLAAFRRRR